MKTSKIAMGVGALALTALAAFTGKANYRATTVWYHPQSAPTSCVSTIIDFNCTTGGSGCLGTSGASAGRQLYSANNCVTTLKPA